MEKYTFTSKEKNTAPLIKELDKESIAEKVTQNTKEAIKKKEEAIPFSDKSTDVILKHLAKETDPNNPDKNADRQYVLSHLLHGRIKALPIKEQVQLMKNSANKVSADPKFEGAYAVVEDYVLHNLLNSFISTAYRYQTDPHKNPDDCADLKQIHNLIGTLSSSQLQALDKINKEYSSMVSSSSPEFADYRVAYTSIQATVDKAITDATTLDATVYQDTSDNLSKTNAQTKLNDAQKDNNSQTTQPVQDQTEEKEEQEESIAETITDAVVTIIVSKEFAETLTNPNDPIVSALTDEYIEEIENETGEKCIIEIEDTNVYGTPDFVEGIIYKGTHGTATTDNTPDNELDDVPVMTYTKHDNN